jgi:hypothetical protein
MKEKTCTGTLDKFRRYVTSTRFHPHDYVEDFCYGETWTPATVVLAYGLRDALERLQLLAAAGASWRGKEVHFAYALFRCLRHNTADLLVAVMSMADVPPVHVTMLLVTKMPDSDEYYEHVTVTPLRSFAIWWDGSVDTVQQLLSVLRLSPDDFAPYFPERHQWQTTTMARLWTAQSRRWSPLRAAWCGAVAPA